MQLDDQVALVTASAISILTSGCLTSRVIYLDEGMYPP